jgi:hypothetical protein
LEEGERIRLQREAEAAEEARKQKELVPLLLMSLVVIDTDVL